MSLTHLFQKKSPGYQSTGRHVFQLQNVPPQTDTRLALDYSKNIKFLFGPRFPPAKN